MKFLKIPTLLLLLSISANAQIITGTLTITNAPVNTSTVTVSGKIFTWTNGTPIGPQAVLITNTFGGDATNLFNVAGLVLPFQAGVTLTNVSSGVVAFSGIGLTAGISAGWATLAFATNGTAPATNVVVPIANGADLASRAPIESQLVSDINSYSATPLATNTPAVANLVDLFNAQSVSNKILFLVNIYSGTISNVYITNALAISGVVNSLTNGAWTGAILTNGQNFGNPFRSPGSGTGSEQFGLNATASANGALAIGDAAVAGGNSVALGFTALGSGLFCTAVGALANATNVEDSAFGKSAQATGGLSTAIGYSARAINGSDTAIGASSQTTGPNQIMLGASTSYVVFPAGDLHRGTSTNITTDGTNTIGGALAFTKYANSSLANGYNADINVGTNPVVIVSGPSSLFTNVGFVAGVDQQQVTIKNYTGQTMTFLDQSGLESTAANRFNLGYAYSNTLNPGIVTFQYNGAISRWEILSHN